MEALRSKRFASVAIVHHTATWTSLVEEELLSFLKDKADSIVYLTHSFKNTRDNLPLNTRVDVYEQGKPIKTTIGPKAFGHEVFFFIKDVLFTVFYFLFWQKRIDVYFGVDNLNAFSGIVLKKLGKVGKVIYYVIDYVPIRFKNPILNKIYHFLDFYAVKNCDQTWNLSGEMARARLNDGLPEKYLAKQITVPIGCHPQKLKKVKLSPGEEKRMAFLGSLSQEQGIKLLIESMPLVVQKIPKIKLVVIGSGPLFKDLKKRVRELKIESFVEFKGFIKDNREVDKILASCHLGLAPYILEETSFKHFTDPGKIKTYLGAGLPVVMTNISHMARVVAKNGAGVVVSDNQEELASAIERIFSDEVFYQKLCQNARMLAQEYDWKKIFDKAFKKT